MQYDFDQVVDRSKNLSAKYDERVKKFGTDDVIPLWIADMNFKTAPCITEAIVELQSRRGPDPQRHDPALYPPERQCSDPDPRVR